MLIDLHAHHLTPAMFDRDPHWGPTWVGNNLKIGDYVLRNRKMPAMAKVDNSDPAGAMFDRMDHPFRLQLMDEMGVDKLVVSIPPLNVHVLDRRLRRRLCEALQRRARALVRRRAGQVPVVGDGADAPARAGGRGARARGQDGGRRALPGRRRARRLRAA